MATLSIKYPTLMDVARRLDPDGKVATVVEMLNETNEILQDLVWVEANNVTSHLTTVRTGLPTATWRKLYQGVQPQKTTTKQVTDTIGMLETRAIVDCDLAELNGNEASWRLSEERAFFEGINQQMAETLFYGDTTTTPERFMGLSARYNAYGTDKTKSTFNAINGGGTSTNDNTSIWFVISGPNTVHGLYPKGSKAGLTMEDKGKVTVEDADKGRYDVYETKYTWKCGLSVRDWRAVCRIANLDVTKLNSNSNTPADLFLQLTKAYHRVRRHMGLGRTAIYCNATVLQALDVQAQNKTNLHIGYTEIDGKLILSYRGIPIRLCDEILDTEAAIASA